MEPVEKLIKALAEIWAEEDIKAGRYSNHFNKDIGEVQIQGDDHGVVNQISGG